MKLWATTLINTSHAVISWSKLDNGHLQHSILLQKTEEPTHNKCLQKMLWRCCSATHDVFLVVGKIHRVEWPSGVLLRRDKPLIWLDRHVEHPTWQHGRRHNLDMLHVEALTSKRRTLLHVYLQLNPQFSELLYFLFVLRETGVSALSGYDLPVFEKVPQNLKATYKLLMPGHRSMDAETGQIYC